MSYNYDLPPTSGNFEPDTVAETEINADDSPANFDIAIVGLSCRFPGAPNAGKFWENLQNGVESVTFFSDDELLAAGVNPEWLHDPNYIKAAPVLEDADKFDAGFFGYSPREATLTDPQQRLFLETCWEAVEDAGYDAENYPGAVSVYAGAGLSGYLLVNLLSNYRVTESTDFHQFTLGNDKDFLATRVSYKLNLKGASLTVQTACSTSLVAVHLACQSLLNYQSDMAIAGGVTVRQPQQSGYNYQEGNVFSPDGHCRAFDAQAGGTLFGSGVGVVVLKRLVDAQADGDFIHAVIKGSAINNDGNNKVGYTAPSVDGQAEVIAMAQAVANVSPESISYIEAHGTGTALGDPIEVAALTQIFRAATDARHFCAIGSVKTNFGHLDSAAGIAGLIKTVLALQNRQLPPSLHFESPNPRIDFANSPFYVNTTLTEWAAGDTPRRAGVSSFGMGGTNAHVILEEAPEPAAEIRPARPYKLLSLSARSAAALETATDRLETYLAQNPEANLADVAYTLQTGRKAFRYRRSFVCKNTTEAREILALRDPQKLLSSQTPGKNRLIFMFPGQGAQYPNMGRDLYDSEPVFRQAIGRCAALLEPALGLDIRSLIYPTADGESSAAEQLRQTWLAQPALFTVEYAFAQLWQAWGVTPQAYTGHSVGEFTAACLAGVFRLEDALALVAARGRLMQGLPQGAMLSVALSEPALTPYIEQDLWIAAINTPTRCVVSGTSEAIERLKKRLADADIDFSPLYTSHAFHSAMMNPILGTFAEQVARVKRQAPTTPFLSNLTGEWISSEMAVDPEYWAKHLRETVRFADGVQTLLKESDWAFVEVGPGQTLSTLVKRHPARPASTPVLSSSRHPHNPQSDLGFLLNSLGALWQAGGSVDWQKFYAAEKRRRLPLPTYPFERQRYWLEAKRPVAEPVAAGIPPLPSAARNLPERKVSGDTLLERVIMEQVEIMSQQLDIWRKPL
jgi:phthiocerol/phenolphthiocerol synthesis type-I polyketide synthase E